MVKRVLIVDDSNFMRMSIKNILSKHGHTVVGEAENGEMGVEKYKELSPDLVTLDVTMREMGGLEALHEIIKYDVNAKVIMVSAMGQEPIVKAAIRLGAKAFLVKPFNEEVVKATLSKL